MPDLVTELEQRWAISVDPPFPRLSYNYVAPAVGADGTRVVLKLSMPDKEFRAEVAVLRLYDGRAMSRLLESDDERGAMLLERVEPGTPVHTLRDDAAEISIAADLMKELRHPAPVDHPFPTVGDWGKAFTSHKEEHGGTSGPLPQVLFDRAETLYRDLDASATDRVVLHGDLHHDNILAARRRPWLAIDPQGVVGDPAFEVGPLLLNLWEDLYEIPDPRRTLLRRVDQLSEELGIDRLRIHGWGIARCVLSAVWSAEDGGDNWHTAIAHAELLASTAD